MKKGFTLIELVIVMVILAILVTLGVPKFLGQSDKAQKTKLISDGRVLEDAINRYYIDEGDWPRLTPEDQPLTDAELTSKIYALNDKGFETPFAPEEGAKYYDVDLDALKPYIKSFNSDIKHFVLQNPVGSVYIQDPKENTRLSGLTETPTQNQEPVASFTMTPEDGITTTTEITFTSTSTDPDGDEITDTEWTGKQSIYSEEGVYAVTLRVKDEHGLWSKPTSKTFTVTNMDGVSQVIAGVSHSIFLMEDGTVKALGRNYYGQLGVETNVGTNTPILTPTVIPGLLNVKRVVTGNHHTIALLEDGTVKAFGLNRTGQLGTITNNGNTNANPTPTTIPGLFGVKNIVAGSNHALALMEDGTLKSFGSNYNGQLGIAANSGTTNPNPTPTTISGLFGVRDVVAGQNHTIALMEDGTVIAFGHNEYGQLGIATNSGTTKPNPTPTTISGLSGVKEIATRGGHTLALLGDGTVMAFGYNNYGQLGTIINNGTTNDNPTPTIVPGLSDVNNVVAGYGHSIAILSDGTVKTFGYNLYGQLGIGSYNTQSTPTDVPELFGAKSISAYNHNLALMNDGTVKAFGINDYAQIGNGGTTNQKTPIAINGL